MEIRSSLSAPASAAFSPETAPIAAVVPRTPFCTVVVRPNPPEQGAPLVRLMSAITTLTEQHDRTMGAMAQQMICVKQQLLASKARQRENQLSFNARLQAATIEQAALQEANRKRIQYNRLGEVHQWVRRLPGGFFDLDFACDCGVWYFPAEQKHRPRTWKVVEILMERDPHLDASAVITKLSSAWRTFKSAYEDYKAYFRAKMRADGTYLARLNTAMSQYPYKRPWLDPEGDFRNYDAIIEKVDFLITNLETGR